MPGFGKKILSGFVTLTSRPPTSTSASYSAALERDHADERALEAERRTQEAIPLEIDPIVRTADQDGDRAATRAHVELHRDERADVDPVVLDDLLPDDVAAERADPEVVRHVALPVVR